MPTLRVSPSRPIRPIPAKGIPAWPWITLALGTIPLLFMGLIVWYDVSGGIVFGDIDWYAAGLRGLLSDGPLYDPTKLAPHALERPVFWDQAPSTALFTLLLLPGDGWLWGFTMLAATVIGLAIVWPRVGAGGAVLLAPVLVLWLPVTAALFWANVNGLVFCLLAVAWRFPRVAGVAIGTAAAIKLLPALAIAWLVGKRDWRGVMWATAIPVAATLIVIAWKGPATIVDFIVLRASQYVPADASLYRWGPVDAGLPTAVAYGIGLGLAFFAWRYASFSLAVLAMLLSIPAMHAHYWTWVLVPFFGIWMPWLITHLRRSSDPIQGSTSSAHHRPTRRLWLTTKQPDECVPTVRAIRFFR